MKRLFLILSMIFLLTSCTPKQQCSIVKIATQGAMNLAYNQLQKRDIDKGLLEKIDENMEKSIDIIRDTILPKLRNHDAQNVTRQQLDEFLELLNTNMGEEEKVALQSGINIALESAELPDAGKKGIGSFLINTIICMFEGVLGALEDRLGKEKSLEKPSEFKCEWKRKDLS